MILSAPKLSVKSYYNMKWQIGPLELKGKGDAYNKIGELIEVEILS